MYLLKLAIWSLLKTPDIVRLKIQCEIDAGRVAGPFDNRPIATLRVSPLGLVPKKEPGEFRLIHLLSFTHGNSLNDFRDLKLCSVQYTNFDEVIHMVQDLGHGCLLGKSDIKWACPLYRVVPIDFDQLGFCFDGKYHFHKAMPFGCSIACQTWNYFPVFLNFALLRLRKLFHYLDDFCLVGKSEPVTVPASWMY